MRELSVAEAWRVLQRHPHLRVNDIPLQTGVLLEDEFFVVANREGEVKVFTLVMQ